MSVSASAKSSMSVGEGEYLGGADKGEVAGIPQNDQPAACIVAEADRSQGTGGAFAGKGGGGGEVRGRLSNHSMLIAVFSVQRQQPFEGVLGHFDPQRPRRPAAELAVGVKEEVAGPDAAGLEAVAEGVFVVNSARPRQP